MTNTCCWVWLVSVCARCADLFATLPDAEKQVVQDGATTLLWFAHPAERFLLVTDVATAERVTEKLRGEAQLNNSQQWLSLNIEAGLPVIDTPNSAQFIPQATNLQALGGISFKKGCYTGQEMVARAKFRGANKRARCGIWRAKPAALRKRVKTSKCRWGKLAPHRYRAGFCPA